MAIKTTLPKITHFDFPLVFEVIINFGLVLTLSPNSNGVASISFANNTLELNWKIHNDQYHLLHGIDISDNG